MGKKNRKRRGHWCWVCASHRPNERFSGKGHKRHVCRDCAKLGAEALEAIQLERDVDRCLDVDGRVLRKYRATFAGYLAHPDPRVRRYAEARQRACEAEWRQALDEAELTEYHARLHELIADDPYP